MQSIVKIHATCENLCPHEVFFSKRANIENLTIFMTEAVSELKIGLREAKSCADAQC